MGCDYYTWIETVIEYRNENGETVTYIEKPEFEEYEKHYTVTYLKHDPDFDAPLEDELKAEIKRYGEPILYNGTRWVCQKAGVDRVTTLLEEQNILLSNVVRVFKRTNGYWR
jgi:hypothetical protein